MEPKRKFSLGGALFDWPVAAGHAQAQQHAPKTWRKLFRDKHLCPAVLSGIFTSCRAGRDWALRNADDVSLTLNTSVPSTIPSTTHSSSNLAATPAAPQPAAVATDSAAGKTADAWSGRADALNQTLAARGALGVAVHVMHDSTPASAHACAVGVPALLCGSGAVITKLSVIQTDPHRTSTTATALLHTLTPILGPHLNTLSLNSCTCTIPPPGALPNLRHLGLTAAGNYKDDPTTIDSVFRSAAPHLAQLHEFEFNHKREKDFEAEGADEVVWEHLAPAAPSQSLVSFKHNDNLGNDLMAFLFSYAPALTTLGVHWVNWSIMYEYEGRTWGVTQVNVGATENSAWGLAQLPRGRAGKTTVRVHSVAFDFDTSSYDGVQVSCIVS